MEFSRKNLLILMYFVLCCVIMVGTLIYQDSYTLIHMGFLPYIIIAPGILYFSYKKTGRLGKLLPLFFTIILFLLPLSAIWLNIRSDGNILAGFLPYNDASDYYTDALNLLDGRLFDGLSIRRPIFTSFLSFLFSITGRNLLLILVILVIINAVSCHLLARQVQNLWGSTAAVIVIVLQFFFYRRFAGTTLTENIGLALGTCGGALLLMGTQKTDRKIILFGIVLLSLGMNARAGALLILPVVVLWGSWFFRGKAKLSISFFALGFIAVTLGFLINWGTEKLVVDPEISASKTSMFANYSTTFYGLAVGGKGWGYIYNDHPELQEVTNKEELIYEYAFNSIRENPFLFVRGMTNSFLDFFSPRYGAFSFLYASTSDPCTMENFTKSLVSCPSNFESKEMEARLACIISKISPRIIDIASSLLMALLLLIPLSWGILMCYQKRVQPWHSLLLAIVLGILISVPLVPPRDASKMRAFAVTQPMMITLTAVGLLDLAKFLNKKKNDRSILKMKDKEIIDIRLPSGQVLFVFSLILSTFVIISPIGARLLASHNKQPSVSCPTNLKAISFRFNPGSSIELVQENTVSMNWSGIRAPIKYFRSNIKNFCVSTDAEAAVIDDLLLLEPGYVLIKPALLGVAFDAQLAVISLDEIPLKPDYLTVCGEIRNGIFYSQSITKLENYR